MEHTIKIKVGENEIILETGKMAKQANGSVLARYSECAVLATACCGNSKVEGLDYVPLQVEYNEKYYAAGKIPGGFLKREARPKDKEILVSRLIDRPIRPLFIKEFGREIQVVPTVVSADQINPTDVIAMVAASASLVISDIPFNGPVGAVRVGLIDGEYIINPTFKQLETSEIDIIVSGTDSGITMVEGGAFEVSEESILAAISKAEIVIKEICSALKELASLAGKEKIQFESEEKKLEKYDEVWEFAYSQMEEACFVKGKDNRYAAIKNVKNSVLEKYADYVSDDNSKLFSKLMDDMEYKVVRKSILEKKVRTDGRGVEDIRQIDCMIDVLPRTHGSALFTRGETQSLGIVTLGTKSDEKIIDNIDGDKSYEHFMLHYNFPPFSVGEVGRMGTGRREIGHGHLAERAIRNILPSKEQFPYTIRIVSEILESNGSSSMATVCSGTLALLNAGVPIKKPVAGIAMGLISDGEKVEVLSDILGEEDHLGDMDFKVTGTEDGITAFQMDIKISGISSEIMKRALIQAKKGRMHILGIMNSTISTPKEGLSAYAPKIVSFSIDPEKIGAVIGPGGKVIKSIAEKSEASVNIEDSGLVTIFGKTQESAEMAEAMVKGIVEEPEIGRIYSGTVKRILDFGAFIEILPGKEGLCHISKLSRQRINAVTDVLKPDQEVKVKLLDVDRMGRLNLSYIDAIDPNGARQNERKK